MRLQPLFKHALLLALFVGCFPSLSARDVPMGSGPVAIAIYKNIKIDDLKKSLVAVFAASNFSLVSTTQDKDYLVIYKFSYPVPDEGASTQLILNIKIDGALDKKNRCALCFLRLGYVEKTAIPRALPWMTEYAFKRSLYPDLDKAYRTLFEKTASYVDKLSINYHPLWDGEHNRQAYSNSYIGASFADLKQGIARAFEEAGFVVAAENGSKSPSRTDTLRLTFPYAPGQAVGATYTLGFYNQWDAEGNCFPCEVIEHHDPYQTLPAAGLTGMLERATLPSRFEAALALARDKMQTTTERYLRPGTVYFRPQISAPLGTPRPPPLPPVVT